MLVLESLIYHIHSYGNEFGSHVKGKLINATDVNITNGVISSKIDVNEDKGNCFI